VQEGNFVGREEELRELKGYLEKALAGDGAVCFVTGEAGSGKTALVRHFLQHALAAHSELAVASGTSNAQTGTGDAYLPFREVIAKLTGDTTLRSRRDDAALGESARTVMVRSIQVLVEVAPELVGLFIPFGKLLGGLGRAVMVKAGWMDRLDDVVEQSRDVAAERNRIFEQYTAFLHKLSEEMPLVLFLDDLQWADDASLQLLFHLARRIDGCRILILGAYRPNDLALGRNGGRHPLESLANELMRYYGDIFIDLDAIAPAASRRFVDELIDAEPNRLDGAFRQALFERTGGHALFTVELLRTLRERGDLRRDGQGQWVQVPALDWEELPARVEGVIEERVGRLTGDLTELLTVASVQGEEFFAEVVARVQGLPAREVIHQLGGELSEQHGLVSSRGLVPFGSKKLSRFRFVHGLFQHYLYDDLGEAERAYLHQDVGEALEALAGDDTQEAAAQLARHFEQAGIYEKAAAYRLRAGNHAWHLSAPKEAIDHLIRGLELLSTLPRRQEQLHLELNLQTLLATALVVTKGYAAPHVQEAYARARDLSQQLGNPPGALPALYGLSVFRFARADLEQAVAEGQRVLELAEDAGATAYALGARLVIGSATLHLGQPEAARQHLEAVIAQYDDRQHRAVAYQLGHDPAVGALSYLSLALWVQGYPDQALAAKERALELATNLDHPYSQGYAASFAAMLLQKVGDWPACQKQAEAALQIGRQGRFPLWQALGELTRGYALVRQGELEAGIAQMEEGHELWHTSGAELAMPYQHAFLADAYLRAGRLAEARQAVDDSFRSEQDTWWLAEQLRLRAELLVREDRAGGRAEAEAVLRQALSVARRQGARSLELRAAMSLGRLLGDQRRVAEGNEILNRALDGLTEGFDTLDLQAARQHLGAPEYAGLSAGG
jgi:predicted ATPase